MAVQWQAVILNWTRASALFVSVMRSVMVMYFSAKSEPLMLEKIFVLMELYFTHPNFK